MKKLKGKPKLTPQYAGEFRKGYSQFLSLNLLVKFQGAVFSFFTHFSLDKQRKMGAKE